MNAETINALDQTIQALADQIPDDIDMVQKVEYAENILQQMGYRHYEIVQLEKDVDYTMENSSTSTFIPISGYWIIKEYKNNVWCSPQVLACMEAFTFKQAHIAVYAVHYPAVYMIIHDTKQKMMFDQKVALPALGQSEREHISYYCGYDERYRTVYKAGASTWETEEPNEVLLYIYNKYTEWFNGPIIDLGCGEGRDSLFLASKGERVTGVDISRAALSKARTLAKERRIESEFLERDVIYLRNITEDSYSLALNMGCLHMISDTSQRLHHLQRVFSILKPGGRFILVHCRENWGKGFYSIPHWEQLKKLEAGQSILRRIRTPDKATEIELPVIPYKEAPAEELVEELESVGFAIDMHLSEITDAFGSSEVLIAIKK